MAFQVINDLTKNIGKKGKFVNVKADDTYKKSILQKQIEDLAEQYLAEDGTGDEKKLVFQIPPEYLDVLLDLIDNNSISETLSFKQLEPTLFEIRTKNLNLFD